MCVCKRMHNRTKMHNRENEMKYQFIAGYYHGIVEAENEEEAIEKLRLKPELETLPRQWFKKILLKKIEEKKEVRT